MVGVGKELCRSSSPNPPAKAKNTPVTQISNLDVMCHCQCVFKEKIVQEYLGHKSFPSLTSGIRIVGICHLTFVLKVETAYP